MKISINTRIFGAIVFSAMIMLFSCKKEVDSDNDVPPPITNIEDSNYISRIGYVDSTGELRYGIKFSYDGQKRLISTIDSTRGGEIKNSTYYYNNADTLPFKIFSTTTYRTNTYVDSLTEYIGYNSSGKRIKDSSITARNLGLGYIREQRIAYYSYSNNKMFGDAHTTVLYAPPGTGIGNFYQKDTATFDGNGNIILNVKHKYDVLPSEQITTSVLTYDNKPCPLARFIQFSNPFPHGETFPLELSGHNNRLTTVENRVNQNGSPQHSYDDDLTGFYIYRSNGYPSEINYANNPGSPYSFNEKLVFLYTRL